MNLKIFSVVLGCMSMVGMANATTLVPDSCFSCQAKTVKSEFLTCIEACIKPSKMLNRDEELISKAQSSGWMVSYERNQLTSGEEFYVMKNSENSLYYNGHNQRPLLMFMYDQTKQTKAMVIDVGSLHVRARDGIGTGFRIRIDKNPPTMIYGNVIWNGRGFIFKDLPASVLNQLRSGSSFLMDFALDYHGTEHFEWNLNGSNAAISLVYGH